MRKAVEYRQHAEECRVLAASMDNAAQRELLLTMAENWEDLARDRERTAQARSFAEPKD